MVRAFREKPDAPTFFRAAVAFYPGCSEAVRDEDWRPVLPGVDAFLRVRPGQ